MKISKYQLTVFLNLFLLSCLLEATENHTLNTNWGNGLTRYKDKIFTEAQIRKTDDNIIYSPGVKFIDNGFHRTDKDIWLDVWQPPLSDPETHRPLVIFTHGGSFKGGSEEGVGIDRAGAPDSKMQPFVTRGYVFASIQYRLNFSSTTATSDLLAAIRFFRMNAEHYRIDPNRIILCGGSAGSITSQMAAISPEYATALGQKEKNTSWSDQPSWIAASVTESGAILDQSYLNNHLDGKDCPTMLDVHGVLDTTVDYKTAVSTFNAFASVLPFAQLISLPGVDHGVMDLPQDGVYDADDAGVIAKYMLPVLFSRVITGDQCPATSQGVAQISWGIQFQNHSPVAESQNVTTAEDTAQAITLSATDQDGDALTYSVSTMPMHGVLSGSNANRTYTPDANYNGSDSFTFTANDGKGGTSSATVNITVTSVNDAPIVNIVSPLNGATFNVGSNITVNATATDVDGTISQVEFFYDDGKHGNLSMGVSNAFPYSWTRTNVRVSGSYIITAVATDNNGTVTTSDPITITVK
jgi:hypothetical protein